MNKEIKELEQGFFQQRADERASRRQLEKGFKEEMRHLKDSHREQLEQKDKLIASLQQQLQEQRERVIRQEADFKSRLDAAEQELRDARSMTARVDQQLHQFLANNQEPEDVSDGVRQVLLKIRDRDRELADLRSTQEKEVQRLEREVQEARAALAASEKREMRDAACNTSTVSRQDMPCSPAFVVGTRDEGTSTRRIQCQDQGTSARVPVTDMTTSAVQASAGEEEQQQDRQSGKTRGRKRDGDGDRIVRSRKEEQERKEEGEEGSGEELAIEVRRDEESKKRKHTDAYLQAIRQKVSRF